MAQIPLPDNLLLRLRQIAQQDDLSLARLFEKMLDVYLLSRHQIENESPLDGLDVLQNAESADPIYQEIAAFRALHSTLLNDYPDQYVAIYQGKLVDHDANKLALLERIEKAYPNEYVLMRPVGQQMEREFHLRSPRYIERI